VVEEVAAMARRWAARLAAVSSGIVCDEGGEEVGMRMLVTVLLLDEMLALC